MFGEALISIDIMALLHQVYLSYIRFENFQEWNIQLLCLFMLLCCYSFLIAFNWMTSPKIGCNLFPVGDGAIPRYIDSIETKNSESENVGTVSKRNQGQYATARSKSYHENRNKSNQSINMKNDKGRQHERAKCNYCGTEHGKGKCPAYHKQCSNCQRWNHFAEQINPFMCWRGM